MDPDAPQCDVEFARIADPMKDVITCERGRLRFDGIDVAAMADTTPTPFFLFSEAQIDRNVAAVRDAFRAHHPATRVFYASKACSNLWLIDRVRRGGIDIEVNSGGELWKARTAGFEPRQIIFNGNAKTRAEIAAALQPPIEAIVVDSVFELRRVADVAAELGAHARVSLRVDLNVASETHPGLRTSKGAKAGIDINEAVGAFGLVDSTAQHPSGRHALPHRLADHARRTLPRGARPGARADRAHRDGPRHQARAPRHRRRFRDPVLRPHRRRARHLLRSAAHARRATRRPSATACTRARPDLQLYLEPGRAIAGNTAILVTRVEAEKTKLVEAAHGRITREDWLMVDAGFNTILEHSSYHWYFRAVLANHCSKPPVRPFRLGGPLCDGGDVYAGDPGSDFRYLPTCSKVGDVVVFLDVGAYSLECMSAYNGRDQAGAYMVTEAGLRQIAARRTVQDFVAGEHFRREDG